MVLLGPPAEGLAQLLVDLLDGADLPNHNLLVSTQRPAEMKARRVDFYPADWLNGTVELSLAEIGLYITACALMYERGGPISEELLKSASHAHGRHFNVCLRKLEMCGKLMRNESKLTQKRVEYEMEMAEKRVEIATENAKKRWNINERPDANAHAKQQMQKPSSRRATSSSSSYKNPSLNSQTPSRARDADTAARPPSPARRNGAQSSVPPPPEEAGLVRIDPLALAEGKLKRFRIPTHFAGCQCPSCSEAAQ